MRWVSLGAINDDYAKKSRDFLRRMGPYSTREISGNICFGLKISAFTDKKMLIRSKWSASTDVSNLGDLAQFFNEQTRQDADRFFISQQKMKEANTILEARQGIQRLERFQRFVFYSSLDQLPVILHQVLLPKFFSWYPKGEWMFVSANRNLNIALAALRVLGGVNELADRSFEQFEALGSFRMMTEAQPGGVFYGNRHLSIPFMLFLPVMYGFVASKVTLSFVFLLDQPLPEIREPHPRSGLEFFRTASSTLFSQHPDGDIDNLTPAEVDTFQLIKQEFKKDEVRYFFNEYLENLNSFITHLIDPANFIGSDGKTWVGLDHYRTWLTFERLADEVIFLLTEDSPYLRKLAAFRILDQVSSLASEKPNSQPSFFRDLLLPSSDDLIAEGLKRYTGTIGLHLQELLIKIRSELKKTVLESIYVPGRYDPILETVKVSEGPSISANEYVTGVVRELRNTYHGYHTKQFDTYLLINTGETPNSLPLLAVMAYLALLACPQLFITRKWS